MKNVKCEIKCYASVDQCLLIQNESKSFRRLLSQYVTKVMSNILDDENVSDIFYMHLCFENVSTFHYGRKVSIKYEGNKGSSIVSFISNYGNMTIIECPIEWTNKKGENPIYITDKIDKDDIEFKLCILDSHIEKMKWIIDNMLPSTVRKEQSGLRFDYQIRGGTEEVIFRIQFCDEVTDVSEISKKVKKYFTKPDENGLIIEPGRFVSKKTSPKVVKIEVDLGSIDCPENIIEDFMNYLDKNFDNIKKVIVD